MKHNVMNMTKPKEKKQEEKERRKAEKETRKQQAIMKQMTRRRRIEKIDQAIGSLVFTVNALADYWSVLKQELIAQSSGK